MSDSTPDGSARQVKVGGEAQWPVHREQSAGGSDRDSPDNATPEHGQSTDEEQDPTYNSNEDNQNLQADRGVAPKRDRAALWTMVATVALAVCTFGLAVATADMARSTRKLASFAQQQAHDTQDALDAARRQASAAETANRLLNSPNISVTTINFPAPSLNSNYRASFHVANIGRIPASNVAGRALLTILNPPKIPNTIPKLATYGGVLYPSQGDLGIGFDFHADMKASEITEGFLSNLKADGTYLYFTGRVEYDDLEHKRHVIELCNVLHSDLTTSGPCSEGNSFR